MISYEWRGTFDDAELNSLHAVAAGQARAAGSAWLHVDFEAELRDFYLDACGFTPTHAGLIALSPPEQVKR